MVLGPSGSISFCAPDLNLTGLGGASASVTVDGKCVEIAKDFAVPASDKWTIAPMTGTGGSGSFYAPFYLLNNTTGTVIECGTVETPIGTKVYISWSCYNFGDMAS